MCGLTVLCVQFFIIQSFAVFTIAYTLKLKILHNYWNLTHKEQNLSPEQHNHKHILSHTLFAKHKAIEFDTEVYEKGAWYVHSVLIMFNPSSLFLLCKDKCLSLTRPISSPIYTGVAQPRLHLWLGSDTYSEGRLLAVQLWPWSLRPCCLNRAARCVKGALNPCWTGCVREARVYLSWTRFDLGFRTVLLMNLYLSKCLTEASQGNFKD